MSAYQKKTQIQIEEAVHSSPVGTVLIEFFGKSQEWEGPPSTLFKALLKQAKELGISTRQKAFPKAPHILVRRLNELAPSLKALGIEVVTGLHKGSERRIGIYAKTDNDATYAKFQYKPIGITKTPVTKDPTDATFPSSLCGICKQGLPPDLVNCTYLEGKPVHCSCKQEMEDFFDNLPLGMKIRRERERLNREFLNGNGNTAIEFDSETGTIKEGIEW